MTPMDLKYLRPISILPALSKVFEKVMDKQIRRYLEDHHLLPECQSGFRTNHSCESALLNIIDDIITAEENNKYTILVLLDFSKAFDTVNHEILLAILNYIGFHRSSVSLVSNYLKDRSQIVVIQDSCSASKPLSCGVPQGSILGPLLFTIYTSVFTEQIKHSCYHLYADDTQLYLSFEEVDAEGANWKINDDLNRLAQLAKRHSLLLNPKKSSAVLFGKPKYRDSILSMLSIEINSKPIEIKTDVRNLGLIIDASLRFKGHINKLIRNAYATLKTIYSARYILTRRTKIILCDSIVLSKFNYCDIVYDACIDSLDIKRIQIVQNNCLRLIFGIRRRQRISHKLKEIPWLNMINRRKLHKLCFYHKLILHKMPPYLYNKITYRTDVHNINIRRKDLITPPQYKFSIFERSFAYNIAKNYNAVPANLKNYSCNSFKNQLKKYLLVEQSIK